MQRRVERLYVGILFKPFDGRCGLTVPSSGFRLIRRGPVTRNPVVHQLFFVGIEHTKHRRTVARDQLPKTTGLRVFVALDPALVLQRLEETGQLLGCSQPLIDGLPFETAVIRMHVLGEWALALEHRQQLLLKVEAFNDCAAALPQIVEPIAQRYPAQKLSAIGLKRQQVKRRLHGFLRMAGAGVVDGHMEGEIVRIDPQFTEFVTADQQVQGQLFIAEVVADHLGQIVSTTDTEGQLYRALQVAFIVDGAAVLQIVLGEQFLVNHHVVLRRIAFAQLFQKGSQQPLETRVLPARQ
ncbi:hypothetical protein D3C81_1312690 [compost metagenome]